MSEIISECGRGWIMYGGDCVEVMASFADRSVDHVITDPPYEAEAHTLQRRVKRGGGELHSEPLDFIAMDEPTRSAAGAEFARLARRWCLVFGQQEGMHLWRSAISAGGGKYRRCGVWVKPDGQPQLSGDRWAMGYEMVLSMWCDKGNSRWNGGGRSSVFVCNKNVIASRLEGRAPHPTTKPVPLMLELVELFTDPGETILDPFAGSGTTGVACLRLGRRFIGIEKDPKYFALACDRLRAEEQSSTLQAVRAGQEPLFKVGT